TGEAEGVRSPARWLASERRAELSNYASLANEASGSRGRIRLLDDARGGRQVGGAGAANDVNVGRIVRVDRHGQAAVRSAATKDVLRVTVAILSRVIIRGGEMGHMDVNTERWRRGGVANACACERVVSGTGYDAR